MSGTRSGTDLRIYWSSAFTEIGEYKVKKRRIDKKILRERRDRKI